MSQIIDFPYFFTFLTDLLPQSQWYRSQKPASFAPLWAASLCRRYFFLQSADKRARLTINTERVPAKAHNVIDFTNYRLTDGGFKKEAVVFYLLADTRGSRQVKGSGGNRRLPPCWWGFMRLPRRIRQTARIIRPQKLYKTLWRLL